MLHSELFTVDTSEVIYAVTIQDILSAIERRSQDSHRWRRAICPWESDWR